MGVNPPASNKIHSLPVLVNYHLPSSSSCFTALFPAPAQVYVHANTAAKSRPADGKDETWGSIPLKIIVQGVMLASPELHPYDSNTPDRSLYVLDTRETILRRQRSAIPSHLRSDRASSPAGPYSSQSSPSSFQSSTAGEVWSGKGLVSWALNEPGQGKTLITGRLVRSAEFATVNTGVEGMGALEALMMADEEASWGLEVNISLRSQGMPMTGPLIPEGMVSAQVGTPARQESFHADSSVDIASSPAPHRSGAHILPPRASSSAPSRHDHTPAASTSARRTRGSAGKAKADTSPSNIDSRALNTLNSNTDSIPRPAPTGSSLDHLLPSIPAAVYNNPASLTKDQVHRLLASPAFLDLLEKTAGQTLAESTGGQVVAAPAKRVKHDHADDGGSGEMKCYNCGRTKSSVWRSRTMDDGSAVKVCNACGLYWNSRKEMRPPSMWSAVDEEIIERPRPTSKMVPRNPPSKPNAKAAAAAATAKAKQTLANQSAAFKRTMSAAVNQDAERIAQRRPSTAAAPRSNLNPNKAAPATSPAQSTRAKTMRNANWKHPQGEVASSPGGWVNPEARAVKASEAFEPLPAVGEGSTSGYKTQSGIQSLQLPTSEPGAHWDTDLSTLFDIDAFEENLDKFSDTTHQPLRQSPRKHQKRKHTDMEVDTFRATPKSSFDFSALPPSSPPFPSGGGNGQVSTLLMSSPDFSPLSGVFGPSPVDSTTGVPMRLTPEKNKSGLRNSFTPVQEGREGVGLGVGMGEDGGEAPDMSLEEITKALNESGMDQAAWDELFGFMSEVEAGRAQGEGQQGQMMTGGEGGFNMGGVAGDDWAALFTNLSQ